jgi:alpha-ketoglutaric semialdehyde dehydrogenase
MTIPAIARHLIDGELLGESAKERMNPARPHEVAVLSPEGIGTDADAAIAAAVCAQNGWANTPAPARGAVLLGAAELLRQRLPTIAEDLVREEGKTLAEATGEVGRAIGVLQFFGSLGWSSSGAIYPSATPNTSISTRREPLGVVGLITPWNFPIAIPTWKAAPALISGNTVVLKPAELTPMSATHLGIALRDAGLPNGVFNIVHGRGSVIGD